MDHNEIIKKLNGIFIDVLDNPDIALKNETSASDIEEWDSLNHIQLVVAIEKSFGIKFTAKEIQSWKNIEEMSNSIAGKLNSK
jgi:acyl carrier protein